MNDKAIQEVEKLGFKLVPVKVPDWTINVSAYEVESAVFFDQLVRSGRDKLLTSPRRASGVPNRPIDSGGGVSAIAAGSHHDDDEAR